MVTRPTLTGLVIVGLMVVLVLSQCSIGHGDDPIYFHYEIDGKQVRHEYVLGTKRIGISVMPYPQKGEPYMDPAFGCKVTRVTDKHIDRYATDFLTNIYSTVDVENCNGSYLMLGSFKYYLYDLTNLKMVKHMGVKPRWGMEWEGRWHPTKPDLFYYVWETQIRMRDITGPCETVSGDRVVHDFRKEFPEAERIGVGTKGTPSVDGRYWVFGVSFSARKGQKQGGFQKAFFYDIKLDKVTTVIDCNSPKWLGTSMSGEYMIVAGHIFEKGEGVWSINRHDSSHIFRIAPHVTHSDLAIDCEGNEVYVFENPENDFVEMTELTTSNTTKLVSYVHGTNWKELKRSGFAGQHISGNCWKTPGWVLVSTYGGLPKGTDEICWKSHVNYMLELKKNPRIWRLCHNRSVSGGYWAQAFATINAEGTRAYWGANWGDPSGPTEVYMVEMPRQWHEGLMGESRSIEIKKKVRQVLHLDN